MSLGVRHAWSTRTITLTPRSAFFLITGLALAVVGVSRGWPPAAAFGALLLLLPAFSVVAMLAFRTRLRVRRGLSAGLVGVGDLTQVRLELTTLTAGGPVTLLDAAPTELGGTHALVVNPRPREALRAGYPLRAGARGRFRIGPLRVEQNDLLGLARSAQTIRGGSQLLVTPQVSELPPGPLRGMVQTGREGAGSLRGGQQDDVIPRTYRAGDELRRVDWRATARSANLMVRSEEQPWHNGLLVVLDLTADSHHGRSPESSAEVALAFVASVGALALREGWQLQVVTLDSRLIYAGNSRVEFLTALAEVPTDQTAWPDPELGRWEEGPILLVLGDLSSPAAAEMAVSAAGCEPRLAVVVRSRQWAVEGPQDWPAPAENILAAAGWAVAPYRRADRPETVWQQLGART